MSILSRLFGKPQPRVSNFKAEPVGNGPLPVNGTGKGETRFIDQMWRTLLTSEVLECIHVAEDEVNDLISLMSDLRIDPEKFSGNLEVLLTGRNRADCGRKALTSTLSICKFMWSIDRPPSFPLWFLAGFPDVAVWTGDEESVSFIAGTDEEERIDTITRLLGVDLDALQDSDDMDLDSDDGTMRLRYLRKLIATYISKTGKSLEAAVQEGSANDLYLASDIFEAVGEESNCTLIASMTTKYYLQLKRSYGSSFPDETALLSMAGILDANGYIFGLGNVTVAQVIAVAKETRGMQDRMQEFLVRFEALLLSKDNPECSFEEVLEVCRGESKAIRRSVEHTMASYNGEPMILSGVRSAMLGPGLSELRQEVGVSIVRS